MLSAMFLHRDEMHVCRNSEGEYLIDRNGRAFEAVIEYLRSGGTTYMIPPGVLEATVEREFDYYGIPIPEKKRGVKMIEKLLFS